MEVKKFKLENACVILDVNDVMLDNSALVNVSMKNISISDANLSDLKIERAQMGGAHFKNIGIYPVDHTLYDPKLEQRPLKFENCDLHKSMFDNCDLRNVVMTNCNVEGLVINGVEIGKMMGG